MMMQVELAQSPFDPSLRLAAFSAALGDEGAVVSFTGRARGRGADGSAVSSLVLECYRGVTLQSMKAIAADAHRQFAIPASHILHRAGLIAPGEPIVFVATADRKTVVEGKRVSDRVDREGSRLFKIKSRLHY